MRDVSDHPSATEPNQFHAESPQKNYSGQMMVASL